MDFKVGDTIALRLSYLGPGYFTIESVNDRGTIMKVRHLFDDPGCAMCAEIVFEGGWRAVYTLNNLIRADLVHTEVLP